MFRTLWRSRFCFPASAAGLSGGMGMSDLKLCAAIGAWLGPRMFVALVLTGLAGAVMAVCRALAGGFLRNTLNRVISLVFQSRGKGSRTCGNPALSWPFSRKMPYAPAIAIGAILSLSGHHS
jgi:prepilin peptidase CpaA